VLPDFREVVGLELGPLSLVRIIEELLERKVAAPVQKTKINGRGDSLRWARDTLYPQKLALTSPTSGGRSDGIPRLRTKATEFIFVFDMCSDVIIFYNVRSRMDVNCHLLGYTRHHSLCYSGLFTTPLVVTTISGYEFWPSDVVSGSGPLIFSSSDCWQLTDWLTISNWPVCVWMLLKSNLCVQNRIHLVARFHCLGNGLQYSCF
jgi:hypothetical protein